MGLPRITRLTRDGHRFRMFDPSGNMIVYIDRSEPEADYGASAGTTSPLLDVLENAVFLRDVYANDAAAARVLDKALARVDEASAIDRARALAARAELAVAMREPDAAARSRRQLTDIPLSVEDRRLYDEELKAADVLERWLGE